MLIDAFYNSDSIINESKPRYLFSKTQDGQLKGEGLLGKMSKNILEGFYKKNVPESLINLNGKQTNLGDMLDLYNGYE